jgi:hypothetical protein
MFAHAYKKTENKSQLVSNGESQKQSGGESTFQFVDNRSEAIAQRQMKEMANNSPQAVKLKALQVMANNSQQFHQVAQLQTNKANHSSQNQLLIQKKENNTGLPDHLKTGIENLSGMSLDDVKVHRNSDKPAQFQAHAYAQGTDIHLASGQEKHLPHEAWHVVQQKQGRVKPTMQMKGKVNVNDDRDLEKEADKMGAKALSFSPMNRINTLQNKAINNATVQRRLEFGKDFQKNHQMSPTDFHDSTKVAERLFERGINKSTVVLASDMVDGVANVNPGLETVSAGYDFRYVPNVQTREASNNGDNIKVINGREPYLEGYKDEAIEKVTHLHGMKTEVGSETNVPKSNFNDPEALSSQVANIIFNKWTSGINAIEKYKKGLDDIKLITAEIVKLNSLKLTNIVSETDYNNKAQVVKIKAKNKLEVEITEKTTDFLEKLKTLTYYLLKNEMGGYFEYDINEGTSQLEEISDSFNQTFTSKSDLKDVIVTLGELSDELKKVKNDSFKVYIEAIVGIKGIINKLPETSDYGEE